MERVPEGDLEKMRAIVAEHWPELDFETEWIGRKERRRADLLVDRLHTYLGDVRREGGRVIGSEVEFRFAVDVAESADDAVPTVHEVGEDRANQAIIHGYIDRVEAYPPGAGEHPAARGRGWERMSGGPDGPTVVVDLKTGKNDPESDSGVLAHRAVGRLSGRRAAGAGRGGAAVVTGGSTARDRLQDPCQERLPHRPSAHVGRRVALGFLLRVADAARGMSASSFTAQVESHCADTQRRVHPCRIHTVPAVSS